MNKTLLILSDDKTLKQKYTKTLLQSGFKVADASDLIDGMLIAKKHPIDAIILDEDLENKDIFQNYSKIRKYSQAPIIFLVANSTKEMPSKSDRNGYNTCFEKSDNPAELASYIQIIVSQTELKEKAKPQSYTLTFFCQNRQGGCRSGQVAFLFKGRWLRQRHLPLK